MEKQGRAMFSNPIKQESHGWELPHLKDIHQVQVRVICLAAHKMSSDKNQGVKTHADNGGMLTFSSMTIFAYPFRLLLSQVLSLH